MHSRMLVEKYL